MLYPFVHCSTEELDVKSDEYGGEGQYCDEVDNHRNMPLPADTMTGYISEIGQW